VSIAVNKMERLTLDTNLLLEYWKDQPKRDVVDRILELARDGLVELAVTARIREDVPRDPLASEIDRLPELSVAETGSVTRLGYWRLGRDHLGSEEFQALQRTLAEDLRPGDPRLPDWRDWDHLHAHKLQRRDVFLTWDRRILRLAPHLGSVGVSTMSPEEYLKTRGQ